MGLIYCYGVVESPLNLELKDTKDSPNLDALKTNGLKGFESGQIYLVPFKDLNAIVSDVSEEKFSQEFIDKNVKDMAWLAENGQIHEKVIENVMEKITIIPMKFCTIFKDKKSVEEMLEEKYGDFRFNLNELKGKIEMTVKVYFDSGPLRKKIANDDKEIKDLMKKAEEKKPGARYFDEQKIEILLKEKVREKLGDSTKEIFEKIRALGEKAKKNDLIDKKLTGKDMLLNSVFLMNKNNSKQFKERIGELKKGYSDFEFQVWGPFPPYNFIK